MFVVEPEADKADALLHVRQPVGRDVDAASQSAWAERVSQVTETFVADPANIYGMRMLEGSQGRHVMRYLP